MTTSSEDVLKVLEHVRVKKNDGHLYMMAERIAWMPNGKDSFTISHKYADIKTQKISPEGKPKIQLQVVYEGGSDTFHFVNPNGTQSQLEDRNQVKELLQQLLPKFKRKLSKDIEEKSRILNEDPELFGLYKELVTSNIITAEEFWANYAANKRNEAKVSEKNDTTGQTVGVSAAFLADIQPQVDGCNGIKYNITKEIIEAIFNTYPAVKRKHFESVPHKVTEQEFWQRFFQSHYFHRDRTTTPKDFFVDSSKNDIERALLKGIIDPFVDLSSMDDQTVQFEIVDETDKSKNDSINSLINTNQALIKRFNHHSMMIMESCINQNKNSECIKPNPQPVLNGNIPKKLKTSHTIITPVIDDEELTAAQHERERVKKQRLEEMTQLEDLEDREVHSSKIPVLNIKNRDRYLAGPIPNGDCDTYNSYSYDSNHNNSDNSYHSYLQIKQLVNQWRPRCQSALKPVAAISALSELSPGGALMKTSHTTNLKDEVPLDVLKELKNLNFALNELLRHFWSCFPATTPQLEDKLYQMKATLERFQYVKLQPFVDRLSREYHTTDLSAHLLNRLQVAINRFNTWQAKKSALNARK